MNQPLCETKDTTPGSPDGAQGSASVSTPLVPLPSSLSGSAKTTKTAVDSVKSPVGGIPSNRQAFSDAIPHEVHQTSQLARVSRSWLYAVLHNRLKCLEYVEHTPVDIIDIRTVRKNERKKTNLV